MYGWDDDAGVVLLYELTSIVAFAGGWGLCDGGCDDK